jgi:hypothetical protein
VEAGVARKCLCDAAGLVQPDTAPKTLDHSAPDPCTLDPTPTPFMEASRRARLSAKSQNPNPQVSLLGTWRCLFGPGSVAGGAVKKCLAHAKRLKRGFEGSRGGSTLRRGCMPEELVSSLDGPGNLEHGLEHRLDASGPLPWAKRLVEHSPNPGT